MNKRMTKSQSNRMITGTLAGIAEYYGIDPTIVRVIFIFISIVLVGAPVFLYILLALVIPKADRQRSDRQKKGRKKKQSREVDEDVWNDF